MTSSGALRNVEQEPQAVYFHTYPGNDSCVRDRRERGGERGREGGREREREKQQLLESCSCTLFVQCHVQYLSFLRGDSLYRQCQNTFCTS